MLDGVYVDASVKDGKTTLGFVVFKGKEHLRWSTTSSILSSTKAEREAVEIAKALYPGFNVFCDCANVKGAIYINRTHNGPAHRTAKMGKNPVARPFIDLAMSNPSRMLEKGLKERIYGKIYDPGLKDFCNNEMTTISK